MTNKKRLFTLTITLVALAISLSFCGKKEETPTEPDPAAKNTESTENTDNTSQPANDNATLISEYEAFVNKFCTSVDKAKAADPATQLTMAKDLANDNTKLTDYVSKIAKIRDSLSETDKAKVAELDKKGTDCAKKLAGMSSGDAPKAPSTKDVNKKVDDIKKNIPGL